MATLNVRDRMLGRLAPLLRHMDVTRLSDEQIIRLRARGAPGIVVGGAAPGVTRRDQTITTEHGLMTVRVYQPAARATAARPLIVHYHGGGWMTGLLDQTVHICSTVAAAVDAIVVSADYRMVPEHCFPASVDDCFAALRWTVANAAELGGDPARDAVMGESAGGNLAAAVCLLAREHGGPAIALQTLTYPATDLTLSSPSVAAESHHNLLPEHQLRVVCDRYLGGADATDWRASPLLASTHDGLPPAHILTAEHDTLRDDGARYADALRAAGVPVRYSEYVGMTHGFLDTTLHRRMRRQALAEIAAEQARMLGQRSSHHERPCR